MCGVCGAVQAGARGERALATGVLDRMTDLMAHRGPNDRGTYESPGVALGVRRLSIVDVEAGHQPFANEDGRIWAVQNGELYNHADLRRGLRARGHRFATRCDTEIIPHLYEEHGLDFATRLRGMFGIALWDERARRAVIVRDRLGIKPMYYAVADDGRVVFGSELKSLLASGVVEPTLNYDAIDAFLTLGFVPGPATPLAQVSKLPAGAMLVVDAHGHRVQRFWSYPEPAEDERLTREEHLERLRDKLEESIRLRLMSDVPLGAMLSGGLDSSLVVALMAKNMGEPVKTFSVGFAGSPQSELAAARRVAEAFDCDHHELELSLDDPAVPLDDLVWHLDEPLASLSALGFYGLSRLAAEHVTVALSGQGADEQLGGYRKHVAAALAQRVHAMPRPLRRVGVAAARFARDGRAATVLAADDAVERLLASSGRLSAAARAGVARGPLLELDGHAAANAIRDRLGRPKAALDAALFLDGQLALVDDMLHYFDRASMAHSLEVRVPFLDHEFVELCATIPSRLKVRGLTTKYLLRELSRDLLPREVLTRPKVSFFHRSVGDWFRGQLNESIDDYLLASDPAYAEFLDRAEIHRRAQSYISGASETDGSFLLGVLMLEVWLSSYLPRALAAPASAVRLSA